ncbi:MULTISPECIES: hypothetical protein [unclassified Lonepinella]|uniref:hypothetical protein n=1 Tax=unclassified Lonepinella TaxID=2642006 RepID=UPI003F6E334E
MKLKNLFIASAVALVSVTCKAESKDYSGIYKKNDTVVTFTNLGGNEYKMNYKNTFVDVNDTGRIENDKFYINGQKLWGIFKDDTYEILNNSSVYKKQ